MTFVDCYVSRADRFSLGVEESTGKYYVAFPVNNRLAEYEEYYELDAGAFQDIQSAFARLKGFVESCRQHKEDHRLLVQPGRIRGEPV